MGSGWDKDRNWDIYAHKHPVGHGRSPKTITKNDRNPTDAKLDPYGTGIRPEPYRNGLGASILGPRNRDREKQDPDMIRPPSTDSGHMPNLKWSFADSHMKIEEGGWARETTVRELPTSIELAGVNMRLDEGAIRELHWHKEAEWGYVLEGTTRVTCLDNEGGNFSDEVSKGGLWYFPSGVPHSLQGMGPGGTEFLLIFDNGNFSEEETFLLSDWLAHTPKSVIAQNFRLSPEIFANIPQKEKYIFQGSVPSAIELEQPSRGGVKASKYRFTHKMLDQEPLDATGGQVRITDSTNFPISKTVAAAHATINPGCLRELHWHPNADEWSFFIKGRARVTVFAASGVSRTFNYVAGDVGIVPKSMAHYVENLSDEEPVEMLEIFRAPKFEDFSLEQWLASTPDRMVKEHLFAGDSESGQKFLKALKGTKDPIKSPSRESKL
ncbi:hypothetical protein DTO207G8_4720 [Paecilomyces variotii]|nr:hypothetical protein DTO169E5_7936 [Paecilomyces variotii]KAJ9252658.1 hypothetical protein DTO207G8_4720 [Paecilomyces variotii]KAJ9308570.1 hypothetical protein DTO217A2_1812 [Paecilomyces variotii]KAJ9373075.1 hypothetical protein DTO282E5_2142 [Paecilomyces variotii]KAJ9396797.1 hypothetical protein DTO282F9_6322 [Paecilomyces variotii]